MNWREHPLLAIAGLVLITVALLFFLPAVAGGAQRPPPPSPPKRQRARRKRRRGNPSPRKNGWTNCAEPANWNKEDGTPKPAVAAAVKPPPPPAPRAKPAADDDDNEGAPPSRVKKPIRPSDVADWKVDDYYQRQTRRRSAIGGRRSLAGRTVCRQRERRRTADQAAGIGGGRSVWGDPPAARAGAESETHRGDCRRAGRQRHAAGRRDARTSGGRKAENGRQSDRGRCRLEGAWPAGRARRAKTCSSAWPRRRPRPPRRIGQRSTRKSSAQRRWNW